MKDLKVCPSTLKEGYSTYSPTAIRRLFDNRKVSHTMDYTHSSDTDTEEMLDNIKRISLSGVQEKYSVIIERGKVVFTPQGVGGKYILKPTPSDRGIRYRHSIPANEHLTMQIAKQIFGIDTAENGLIFFRDGAPAYITKRFDTTDSGLKINQEDFASLIGKTKQLNGSDFKYQGSYEDIASEIKRRVAAYPIELAKFFDLVVFNYIFGNNDAHLKNFSLMQTTDGDYKLTPAYDLLNATLHVEDSDFALADGLSATMEHSEVYNTKGHPTVDDFRRFGTQISLSPKQIEKVISKYLKDGVQDDVHSLIDRSLLDDRLKRMYKRSYQQRMDRFIRS